LAKVSRSLLATVLLGRALILICLVGQLEYSAL
jgi:hypothetical protein